MILRNVQVKMVKGRFPKPRVTSFVELKESIISTAAELEFETPDVVVTKLVNGSPGDFVIRLGWERYPEAWIELFVQACDE